MTLIFKMAIDYEKIQREARENFRITYLKQLEKWGFWIEKIWGTTDLDKLQKKRDKRPGFIANITGTMIIGDWLSDHAISILADIYAKRHGDEGSRSYGSAHDDFYHKINKFNG
jgi:hypothetical protein